MLKISATCPAHIRTCIKGQTGDITGEHITALDGSINGSEPSGPVGLAGGYNGPNEHSSSRGVEDSVIHSQKKWQKPVHDLCVRVRVCTCACSDQTECGIRSETTLSAI